MLPEGFVGFSILGWIVLGWRVCLFVVLCVGVGAGFLRVWGWHLVLVLCWNIHFEVFWFWLRFYTYVCGFTCEAGLLGLLTFRLLT